MKTTNQAAEFLGVSLRRVQFLVKKGLLPAQKVGRDWIIDDNDLEDFAAKERPVGRPRKDTQEIQK